MAGDSAAIDLVVFGATGFTGQFVVEELARLSHQEQNKLRRTWAVAGRSQSKLSAVLDQASSQTGADLSSVRIIIADVSDSASLQEMTKQTKLLLNCVGPYRLYGEAVVKACVETGTHYVDISGEPQFLEKMQLEYSDSAEKSNCYVIGACGFDSIPADMGMEFIKKKFDGSVNGVESYFNVKVGDKGYDGIHYATYQSAIYGYAFKGELGPLRRKLFPTRLPKSKFPLPKRGNVHFSDDMGGYCLPFMGSDKSVVQRSVYHNYHNRQQSSVQYNAYVVIGGWFTTMMVIMAAILFGAMASTGWGRWLLERFPRLFSMGKVSHEGPTREQMKQASFSMTFFANGWSQQLPRDEVHTDKPDRNMVAKVSGPECGYVATPICMIQSALTILQEADKMPSTGGVYSPGAAFADTSLIDRLNEHNVKFEVVNEK